MKSSPRIATAASVASMAALLSLGGAPAAFAQGCTGAPGASAIQQYCEAVPRADGGSDRPGGGGSGSGSGGGGGNSSGSGSGVSTQTSEALSGAGADGAAVERLAGGDDGSAAPKSSSSKPKKSSTTESTTPGEDEGAVLAERVDGPADPDGSPLKAATNAVSSGPTAGSGVVWGLVGISVLGAGAAVFLRRRSGDDLTIPDDES